MNRSVLTAVFVTIVLLFWSCKKIVTLKLNNVPAAIVIEGEVDDGPGPYVVTINQPVDFYASNNFPPVSGAVVTITNNLGLKDRTAKTCLYLHVPHSYSGMVCFSAAFCRSPAASAVLPCRSNALARPAWASP